MPIYEYRCRECQHQFEVFQKISDRPKRKCPSCGRRTLEKLISNTAFVLKGGGWYRDGYGSAAAGEKKGGAADTGEKKKTAGGDAKKGSGSGSGESGATGEAGGRSSAARAGAGA